LGVKPSLCGLYKLCSTFYRLLGVSLGVKPSLCGLYKLCKVKPSLCGLYKLCRAFYRWQFLCEAFALRSVQALQCIL
jgi:hypothetical protein